MKMFNFKIDLQWKFPYETQYNDVTNVSVIEETYKAGITSFYYILQFKFQAINAFNLSSVLK